MGTAVNSFAQALVASNRWQEASGVLRGMVAVQVRGKSNATEQCANTAALLGQCLLRDAQFADAEKYLGQAHSILKQVRRGRSETYAVQARWGAALAGQKQHAAAKKNLEEAQAGLEEAFTKDPEPWRARLLAEATEYVLQFYAASGDAGKVEQWKGKLRLVQQMEQRARENDRAVTGLASGTVERRTNAVPIALTGYYNAPLDSDWLAIGGSGPAMTNLLGTDRVFEGIEYEVGGILQLLGAHLKKPGRPTYADGTNGIPVERAARRLHFLLDAAWPVADDTPVGSFVIHFADGEAVEIPILYGHHVRDWVARADRETRVVSGKLAVARRIGQRGIYRVFSFQWENPRPAAIIRSFDFQSKVTDCAPFLLGVTAE